MEILRLEAAETIVIPRINLDPIPGSDVLPGAFEATVVLPTVVEAPEPVTTPSGLPRRKRLDLGESDPDFKMAVLDTHGRKSNAEVDPPRADLLKAVASLGIPELEAFAAGDMSLVHADILAAADSASLTDAKKYAGNIAVVRREQEANYVEIDPEKVNKGLGAIVGARIRAEKVLAERAGKPEVEAPPSSPLPTRVPMQTLNGLKEEQRAILAKTRPGAYRLGRHDFVRLPSQAFEGTPQAQESATTGHNDSDQELTTIIPRLHHRASEETVRIPTPQRPRHERSAGKLTEMLSQVVRLAFGRYEGGRHSHKAVAARIGKTAFAG